MNKKRIYILFLVALISVMQMSGAPVMVKAKLDSVQILMGRMTLLRLEVVQDAQKRGGFEIFNNQRPDGVIGVCGDSVELRTSFERDTVDLGSGRIQINYQVPVQSFDSGFYRLPQLNYIVDKDTFKSNSVSLKVIPVTGVTAESEISGYADVMPPADPSFWDFLPEWLYYYWWVVVLLLAIIAATIYLMRRYRTKGGILPKKPAPSPYQVAMTSLKRLKSRNLCEQGLEREYYTELTEILRQYLDGRFGINAMEMTTKQINEQLAKDVRVKDKKEYMKNVLAMADFVKFAAARMLPDDNVKAYNDAERFIEETRPTPEEEEAEKERLKNAAADSAKAINTKGKNKSKSKSVLKKPNRKGGKK